jgi:hypothetical protein
MREKTRVVVVRPASEPRLRAQGWRPGEAGTSGSELPTGTAGTRASGRSSRLSSRGSGALPRVVATETWAIAPEEITICHRPDGSEWELGAGAYGRVFRGIWCMQAVAVKQARAPASSLWELRGPAPRPVRSARFQNGFAQRRVPAAGPVGGLLPAPASPDAARTSAPSRGPAHRGTPASPPRRAPPQVNRSSEKVDADFLTEISVLKECRNPNIVQVGSAVTRRALVGVAACLVVTRFLLQRWASATNAFSSAGKGLAALGVSLTRGRSPGRLYELSPALERGRRPGLSRAAPRAVPGRVHHAGHDDAGDGGHGGRQPALAAALGRHHLDARARALSPLALPCARLPCVHRARSGARHAGPDRLMQGVWMSTSRGRSLGTRGGCACVEPH